MNILKTTLNIISYSIIILFLFSCKKEENNDTIQFNITTKDTLIVEYYNGKDTVTFQTRLHFSTSYKLKSYNDVYIAIYGEVNSFSLYVNGVLYNYSYKHLKYRDKDGEYIEYKGSIR